MPHPHKYIKVVAEGGLYAAERFAFGFHIVQGPTFQDERIQPVTQAYADQIGGIVKTFFTSTGANISTAAKLDRVKVNRIDTDGHYADPEPFEYVINPAVSGQASAPVPPQNALAISLIGTDNPRALAGRGRFYLPMTGGMGGLDGTGRLPTATVAGIADAVKTLIDNINNVHKSLGVQYAWVGNTSAGKGARAGKQQIVSEIRVGSVVDTVRSRRRSIPEAYTTRAIA
jgi:hypothetical protein